jgi:hypothetical protein
MSTNLLTDSSSVRMSIFFISPIISSSSSYVNETTKQMQASNAQYIKKLAASLLLRQQVLAHQQVATWLIAHATVGACFLLT